MNSENGKTSEHRDNQMETHEQEPVRNPALPMATPDADIMRYCDLMEEIKRRMNVLDFFARSERSAMYTPTTVESACLQLRKILELIAFGSLVANEEAYSAVYSDFAKHWNAGELLKALAKVNPKFYPEPIVPGAPSDRPGIRNIRKRDGDYLNEKEFVQAYGRCGGIMHAANPYGEGIDYEGYKQGLPTWRNRILNLLSAHRIWLVGNQTSYVVHMTGPTVDKVHWYKFVTVNGPRDTRAGQ